MPKVPMIVTEKGAGFYRTRMLKAGDPIRLPGRDVKVHEALGYVTKEAPKARRVVAAATDKPKRAPRKRKPKA